MGGRAGGVSRRAPHRGCRAHAGGTRAPVASRDARRIDCIGGVARPTARCDDDQHARGGVIKTLGVRQGMTVAQGQTLAEVNGLATVQLNAAVPEALAGNLRIGTPVIATLAAFPGESFEGRIAAILPQAEAASRTLTIRVELPNRAGRLRPGMFASVALDQGSRDALLVPSEAVIRTGRRTLVMLAGPGGRFRPAEVRTGAEGARQNRDSRRPDRGREGCRVGPVPDRLRSEPRWPRCASDWCRSVTRNKAGRETHRASIYETVGSIEAIDRSSVTLSHQPVPAIGWPAMTMTFRVADPGVGAWVSQGVSGCGSALINPPMVQRCAACTREARR